MNWSMYTADHSTHLKIVSVALTSALLIAVVGFAGQQLNPGAAFVTAQAPTVINAGAPVVLTERSGAVIR